MALKPAICTQCGGLIEVDDTKEAGICKFCGTAFITEKVVNQYVTQNNYSGATFNFQNGVDIENLYTLARRAVNSENIEEVVKYYSQIRERNPNDWESVFYYSIFTDQSVQSSIECVFEILSSNGMSFDERKKVMLEIADVTYNRNNNYSYARDFIFSAFMNAVKENGDVLNKSILELYYNGIVKYSMNDNSHYLIKTLKDFYNYPIEENNDTRVIYENIVWNGLKYLENYSHTIGEGLLNNCKNLESPADFKLDFFKDYLKTNGCNIYDKEYKTIVKKIKEIDPSYVPEKRKDSPEIRSAKKRRKLITKLAIRFIFDILPFVLINIPFYGYGETYWDNHPFISILLIIPYYFIYIAIRTYKYELSD